MGIIVRMVQRKDVKDSLEDGDYLEFVLTSG